MQKKVNLNMVKISFKVYENNRILSRLSKRILSSDSGKKLKEWEIFYSIILL
jgi:hypothetical protein